MTVQKRSTLHHRRGVHLPGAGHTVQQHVDQPTTTATPAKPAGTSAVISTVPSTVLSSVSGTTVSTTAVAVKSSVTTSSSPTATTHSLSIPTITSATRSAVVHTTTTLRSSTSPYAQGSSSAAARVSTGTSSTATLIGGIGGALGVSILLAFIFAFFVRRWRKKNARNTFDASRFRRSAVLLNDKDEDTYGRSRPPTMIERKNISPTPPATSPASPSPAYPYSDQPPLLSSPPLSRAQSLAQHGANQTQYAVPLQSPSFAAGNQFGGNGGAPVTPGVLYPYGQGHEQAGYGAPPVPGVHGPGTYASYGVDPRDPQSQRYLRPQQYGQQQNQQDQQRQSLAIDDTASSATSLTKEERVSSSVNPFKPLPVIQKLGPIEGFGLTASTPTSNTGSTRGASFVTRQPHEAPLAHTNDGKYTDMKRDVKLSPPSTSPPTVTDKSSDSMGSDTKAVGVTTTTTAEPEEPEPKPRPITVYDDDDVYGGM